MAKDATVTDDEETPADAAAQDETAAEVEAAEETVDDLRGRIREFEARLTKQGRTEAQIKAQSGQLEAKLQEALNELNEAKQANTEWNEWYLKNHATEEQKAAAAAARNASENGTVKAKENEALHWKAIASEENPLVKKALMKAADKGEFMTKGQINALRETFADDDEEEKKPKKEAPKVSGTRATGSVRESIEDRLDKAKKAKDFDAIIAIKQEEAMQKAQARGQ